MPTPFDLISQKLDDPDPMDDLQMQLGQDQGANLAGGPEAKPDAQPDLGALAGAPQPVPASPNVPGPLSALAPKTQAKPKIRLLPKKKKPHFKLRVSAPPPKPKPHIKLKASANV